MSQSSVHCFVVSWQWEHCCSAGEVEAGEGLFCDARGPRNAGIVVEEISR